jgi:hypothetical protein
MFPAIGRLWTALKAILAIGLMAILSLHTAKIAERKGVNPFTAALVDPVTTGSIKASRIHR